MGKRRTKRQNVLPLPAPPETGNSVHSDIVVRIGGQLLKIDFSATVRDITDAPRAPVIPLPKPYNRREE